MSAALLSNVGGAELNREHGDSTAFNHIPQASPSPELSQLRQHKLKSGSGSKYSMRTINQTRIYHKKRRWFHSIHVLICTSRQLGALWMEHQLCAWRSNLWKTWFEAALNRSTSASQQGRRCFNPEHFLSSRRCWCRHRWWVKWLTVRLISESTQSSHLWVITWNEDNLAAALTWIRMIVNWWKQTELQR